MPRNAEGDDRATVEEVAGLSRGCRRRLFTLPFEAATYPPESIGA